MRGCGADGESPVLIFVGVIASGLLIQALANMGHRTDVLMLWLLPLYALAGWLVGQLRSQVLVAGAIVVILVVGGLDLRHAVRQVKGSQQLSREWIEAESGKVQYKVPAVGDQYLPCDPPYTWGSEVWYLQEIMHRGKGIASAWAAGAFPGRAPCASFQPTSGD